MNMRTWLDSLTAKGGGAALPIVSYPAIDLMSGVSVKDVLMSARLQAECVAAAAENMPLCAAAVTLMDLSVEAECFGAEVRISESEVPAVCGSVLTELSDAASLKIPEIGSGRTQICLDAVKLLRGKITDRPIIAGVIGSFSLAGRLTDVTRIMYLCYDEPEALGALLEKCTDFIIDYIKAFKDAGADGILLCEPLAGMLSPALEEEFSAEYIKRIAETVQDDEFILIYHNCGNGVVSMADSVFSNGCAAYHFGNSVELEDMLKKAPAGLPVMGNLNPAGVLRAGTPREVRREVRELRERCGAYPGFVLSTGCDVPPGTPWENILAIFEN